MKITEKVTMLDAAPQSHVFLICGEENILIDTGFPGQSAKILAELKSLGVKPESVKKILLTHHDIDHIGNAAALQKATGAELWAPEEDIPYIRREKSRPGVKKILGTLVRPALPEITGSFARQSSFGGVTAHFAPGHTPGHTFFAFENVLFIGDLFRNIHKIEMLPGIMTWSMEEARKSIALLKNLEFEWVCPAHGKPIKGRPELEAFLQNF